MTCISSGLARELAAWCAGAVQGPKRDVAHRVRVHSFSLFMAANSAEGGVGVGMGELDQSWLPAGWIFWH